MVVKMEKELEILKHIKEGWVTFSFQKIEQLATMENNCRKYLDALCRIANFEENLEDYYGGVSHNWQKFAHDIMEIAQDAILDVPNITGKYKGKMK